MDGAVSLGRALLRPSGSRADARTGQPVLASVERLLQTARETIEHLPGDDTELDLLLTAIHARRQTVRAMTAELTTLEAQLAVLERAIRRHATTPHAATPHAVTPRAGTHPRLTAHEPHARPTLGTVEPPVTTRRPPRARETHMAEKKSGFGLDDLGALAGKAKEHLTDENIDAIAQKVTAVAPDSVDKAVAALAEKAKQANN